MCSDSRPLLWTMICGESGVGKSRLALFISKEMKDIYGWDIITPSDFDKDDIYRRFNSSENKVTQNLLVCVDYVGRNIESTINIIKNIDKQEYYSKYKIRFILIERNSEIITREQEDILEYKYIDEQYIYKDAILLSADENGLDLLEDIAKDYIKKYSEICSKIIDYSTETSVFFRTTLSTLGPEAYTPLISQIIADYICHTVDISNPPQTIKDYLDNIIKQEANKYKEAINSLLYSSEDELEISEIGKNILEEEDSSDTSYYFNIVDESSNKEELGSYFSAIVECTLLISTYLGGINESDAYFILTKQLNANISYDVFHKLLERVGRIKDDDIIIPYETDKIGENFCLEEINKLNEESFSFLYSILLNKDFTRTIGYTINIFDDFCTDQTSNTFTNVISRLVIPSGITTIPANFIRGCSFIKDVVLSDDVQIIEAGAFSIILKILD